VALAKRFVDQVAPLFGLLCLLSPSVVLGAKLHPETIRAWERYVMLTEARIEREIASDERFLVLDHIDPRDASRCRRVLSMDRVCTMERETRDEEGKKIDVPKGKIHHWYGAVFVPGASVSEVVEWTKRYEGKEDVYDEVEESRVISRETDDEYSVYLRLRRRKVVTAVYNTEHEVRYRRHDDRHVSSRTIATRIREVEQLGNGREAEKPEGNDRGYLWRLNSYWRFQQVEGGTIVECESMSLSRKVPIGLSWLLKLFVKSVPSESLESVLLPIRRSLASTADSVAF
jgi:hypothetical protein